MKRKTELGGKQINTKRKW